MPYLMQVIEPTLTDKTIIFFTQHSLPTLPNLTSSAFTQHSQPTLTDMTSSFFIQPDSQVRLFRGRGHDLILVFCMSAGSSAVEPS